MLTKLRTMRANAVALRKDRGATDPILVIAAIAVSLILLIGGSFMVSNLINSGHDLNAKGDLDKVTIAEDSAFAAGDKFIAYRSVAAGGTGAVLDLEKSTIGFKPTDGQKVAVRVVPTAGSHWVAAAKSKANTASVFLKSSVTNKVYTNSTADIAAIQAALVADGVTAAVATAMISGAIADVA